MGSGDNFKDINRFLANNNFRWGDELKPWMVANKSYRITYLYHDSWNYPIYTIVLLRHDEVVFRGRLPDSHIAELVYNSIKEDYMFDNNPNWLNSK